MIIFMFTPQQACSEVQREFLEQNGKILSRERWALYSLQAAAALCDLLIVSCLEVSDLSLGCFIIQEKKNDFCASSHR